MFKSIEMVYLKPSKFNIFPILFAWDKAYALIAYLGVWNWSEIVLNFCLPLVEQNTELPILSHLHVLVRQKLLVFILSL